MISVIIPVYNRCKTIERAVRSVLNQTVSDLEVIVVDDCSDDEIENVLKQIDDRRIRYFCLEQRSGACVARNRGVEEAKGEFIAFQDSDDEWLPEKLEIQISEMNSNNADICFCKLRRHYIGENAKVILWPENSGTQSRFMDHVTLRRRSYVSTQTIVARKHVFDEVLFDPKVVKSQDYDWIIRASEKYRTFFVALPLVEQYLQSDSISLSGSEKFVVSREYFLKKYRDLCLQDKEFKLHLLKQLAYYKSLSGKNASKEYSEIFSEEKSIHNFVNKILSALGLMKIVRKIQKK